MIKETKKNILITGANGFIGKNLYIRLEESNNFKVFKFLKDDSIDDLENLLNQADILFHLAGENRPHDDSLFEKANVSFTKKITEIVKKNLLKTHIIFSSSAQGEIDNEYGRSKLSAEKILKKLSKENGNPVSIYRLPGVFGKWCLPNYNSVVATFCHNIANNLPINIDDKEHKINLVYIDDVIDSFINEFQSQNEDFCFCNIKNQYEISLGDLANQIYVFKNSRKSLITEKVGTGFNRALYATYISYLDPKNFSYEIESHVDSRGNFVEMLKTKDSGQFSFFTAHPGIKRGGHYHHTKSEKFLVVQGNAKFSFRHVISNETFTVYTSADKPTIVETIPGWSHDIKNIGKNLMIVMLWANEQFNKELPDTITSEVINE